MKQFISFIRKEFFHIFRDRRTMLILLGMPIVQIILFGFAITTEVKNVRVAVLDPSNDVVTRRIIDRMDASEYFTVIRRLHSPADMEASFGRGEIDMALVFSERFSDKLLYRRGARAACLRRHRPQYGDYAGRLCRKHHLLCRAGDASAGSACRCHRTPAQAAVQSADEECLQLRAGCHGAYSDADLRHDDLHLHCARKETGTMEVLLVSPVKPLFIILAKAVPYFVLSFVNLTTILLLSVYVLDVPVAGSLFWLVVVSLLFIFVSLALGLLISTVTRTQVAAMLVSGLMLMMPTMLLSGMIFPIESMPVILQAISAVLPARWYIQAVRKLMIEGVDVSLVLMEVGILATMAVLLITVSFKKFKHRLE